MTKSSFNKEQAERMIVDANQTLQSTVETLHNGDTANAFLETAKKVIASLMAANILMAKDETIDGYDSATQTVQDSLMTILDWLITLTDDSDGDTE